MDAQLDALLDELYRTGRAYDAEQEDRLDRLRNVEPDTARLLSVLARATGCTRLLELGTSNGYSTLWLADAMADTGGHVTSVDNYPDRTALATANLARGGLTGRVTLLTEDAGRVLAAAPDAAYDLVFLDAERPHYPGYWSDLVRVLRPGGLLAVDNVLSHADQVAGFRDMVTADDRVLDALAPTGAGCLLVVRRT